MDKKIKDIIDNAPVTSGCYLFKNKNNIVLYVGKSKSLKNRLKSYYNKEHSHSKLNKLISEATDIEIILTENETEALILECDLIKKIQPRYNTDLKKNRSDFYMRIGLKEEFPSITIENKIHRDGGKYYGVYNKTEYVKESILLLNEIWKTPTCNKKELEKINRPCLQWDMKKCVAPCSKISSKEYKKIIRNIVSFFNSNDDKLLKKLEKQLKEYAKKLEYEKAGEVKVRLDNIIKLRKKIKRLDKGVNYKNLLLFFRGYNEKGVTIFYIEKDKILLDYRFNNINFEKEKVINMIDKIKKKDFVDNNYSLKNLLEIKCDKMFVKINFDKNDIDILEDIKEQWGEFFGSTIFV